MKNIFVLIIMLVSAVFGIAQSIEGQWNGLLKVQGAQLRLVFHITLEEGQYLATMDSPDQGAKGIKVQSAVFDPPNLTLSLPNLGIQYEGLLNQDQTISGTFKQGALTVPLVLSKEKPARPQVPQPPFDYTSEDIFFQNQQAGIQLAGTLTIPNGEGPFPAVILISGSGPQNRNEEIFDHQPFLVIADYLSRSGVAVLRFDDRGVGESEGNFALATSEDFASDVMAAFNYIKKRSEVDAGKIGLVGHSEGGLIAPMVASKSEEVAFLVLLAGTGIPGDSLLLLQQRLIGQSLGLSDETLDKTEKLNRTAFQMIRNNAGEAEIKDFIREVSNEEMAEAQYSQLMQPWMLYFLQYDPAIVLEKLTLPILALNGSKDLQVPPKENLGAIEKALLKAGNTRYKLMELEGLNHLFQECETGAPSEYGMIEQTFSPKALEIIKDWLTSLF
jgi:uncharacterized protein